MLAILVALAATTGLVTALSSVATPAHARVNQGECPGSQEGRCTSGGQGPGTFSTGFGGHTVTNPSTGEQTISGGIGHVGGAHFTSSPSGTTCVGSACP